MVTYLWIEALSEIGIMIEDNSGNQRLVVILKTSNDLVESPAIVGSFKT